MTWLPFGFFPGKTWCDFSSGASEWLDFVGGAWLGLALGSWILGCPGQIITELLGRVAESRDHVMDGADVKLLGAWLRWDFWLSSL